MKTTPFVKVLTDIRFWIILLFALRLVGINNAPLDSHNWRQTLTSMVARNFVEEGANLFYPKIDLAGENSGIIASEFPLFNYLIYIISNIFNYSHWIGRLINLLISSLGMFYFFKLIKGVVNHRTAFNATIVLAASIWFAHSRKIMPDTFSVSLVIIGLCHAFVYIKKGSKWALILFFFFCTLGALSKIPALSLISVLAVLVFIKEVDLRKKIAIFSTGAMSLLIVCLWYFYWVPFLLKSYGYQLFFPKTMTEGIREIIPQFSELLEKFYFSSLNSFIALVCCLIGLYLILRSGQRFLILGLGIITSVFIVFIIKTGAVFPLHSYYIIPFTPIMALLAGYAISEIPIKLQYLLLVSILVEGIANQQHDFFTNEDQLYKLELEAIAKNVIPAKDLVVINGGPSPQNMYFSHRKGWTENNETILRPNYLDSVINLGAKFLIVDESYGDLKFHQNEIVFKNTSYSIYRLKNNNVH